MELWINSGGINWTWYTKVRLINDTAEILLHDRLHNTRDDGHPEKTISGRIVEDTARNAVAVKFEGKTIPVTNVRQVFDYPKFYD